MDDQRPVTHAFDSIEHMRAVEDSLTLRCQRCNEVADDQAGVHVQAGKRLIEHHNVGIVEQRRSQQGLLAHALGITV